jgi:glycosyltransferase involved in cell wall biosynthesis
MNFRRFDAVVAVSRALYDQTRASGVHSDRLHVVQNAWGGSNEPLSREAARLKLGLPHDALVVGWVGRLIRVKGGDLLLDAISHLPEPRPLTVMIGYGPQEDELRRLTKQLGLDSVVQFHTQINDAGLYFRAFDTYVLSSRSEGLPIVLFEAMAAETPMVATRVGGVSEVIGQGEAWLVPSEDPIRLAECIATSLRDRATAHEFAQRATRRLSTDYALNTFLEKYEAIYYGVVARKAGRDHRRKRGAT